MFGRDAKERSDESLAARARRGSLASFEILVQRYHPRLLDFLMRRGAPRTDAEDLVQDAFLRAWDKLDAYDPRRRFSTWLFTLTARVAISESRRRRPVPVDPAQWPESAAHSQSVPDPAETVADQDLGRQLWQVVDRELPSEQAGLMWLRYAEGLEIADLAEICGKQPGAVRVLLHRARARLARHLRPWQPEGHDGGEASASPDPGAAPASLRAGETE